MAADITVERFAIDGGASLGAITAPLLRLTTEHLLYGGADRASLEFEATWGGGFVTNTDEFLVVTGGAGVKVFSGRVVSVSPILGGSKQAVELEGWHRRLAELPLIADPATDRIEFGFGAADHPEVETAFALASWLATNAIYADPMNPVATGTLTAPSRPCKFGGVYQIFAADRLGKVLDDLAAMEDAIWGIDAGGRFYFTPRPTVEATAGLSLRVAEAPGAGWRGLSGRAFARGGRFTQTRRPPTSFLIGSRDATNARGNRLFTYAQALGDDTDARRLARWYAPQVRTVPAARRLARGLFRRFSSTGGDFGVRADGLEVFGGWQAMEPHLGLASIYDGGELLNSGLLGSVSVDWLGTISASVTLGELRSQPGSGNPVTDPFSLDAAAVRYDDPQIDQGDAWQIDEADGYDGDGDNFQFDAGLDVPPSPPAAADPPDSIDYGSNLAAVSEGGARAVGTLERCKVISASSSTGPWYVAILDDEGTATDEEFGPVTSWAPGATFLVDDFGILWFWHASESPLLIASGAGGTVVIDDGEPYIAGSIRFFSS